MERLINIVLGLLLIMVVTYGLIPKDPPSDKILVDKAWILDTGLMVERDGDFIQIDPSTTYAYRINNNKLAVDEEWLFDSGLIRYGKNANLILLNTNISYFDMAKITMDSISDRNKMLEILEKERRK